MKKEMVKTESVVLLAATVIILVTGLSVVELSRAQENAHTRGYYDAIRDYHGKGYDPSCPSGHSAAFCANYQSGYGAGWHVAQGANGVDMGSSNNGGSSSSNIGGSSSDNSGMGTSSSDNSGVSSSNNNNNNPSGSVDCASNPMCRVPAAGGSCWWDPASCKSSLPTTCTIPDPPCAVPDVDKSAANEGDTITLDGYRSTDSGGEHRLLFHWEQVPTGGPTVVLSDPNVAAPTFTAPKDIQDSTKLTFRLVVTDNLDKNDKAYHGNPASEPANVDVNICATKKDPLLPTLGDGPSSSEVDVPDTKTGKCDYSQVDIRATFAYFGYKHLFLVYTDQEGKKQTLFRGTGPTYITGTIIPCNTYNGEGSETNDCKDMNVGSKILLKGSDAYDAAKCFNKVAVKVTEARVPYKYFGPNSNTFVRTLLNICGVKSDVNGNAGVYLLPGLGEVPDARFVPGWGDPDLVQCKYSKSDDKCE